MNKLPLCSSDYRLAAGGKGRTRPGGGEEKEEGRQRKEEVEDNDEKSRGRP